MATCHISEIWQSAPAALKERLLLEVLDSRRHLGHALRDRVDRELRLIRVHGFRDGRRAPPGILAPAVASWSMAGHVARFACVFLEAWVSLKPELVARVVDSLRSHGVAPGSLAPIPAVLEPRASDTVLASVVSDCQQGPDEADQEALALIARLLQATPVDAAAAGMAVPEVIGRKAKEQSLREPWETILRQAEGVPPQDAAWSEAEEFVVRFRAIASAKSSVQEEAWAAVNAQRDEIAERFAATLAYIGAELPSPVGPNAAFSPTEASESLGETSGLLEKIESHRIKSCPTLALDNQRRDAIATLVRELEQVLAELGPFELGEDDREPEPVDPATPEPQATTRTQTEGAPTPGVLLGQKPSGKEVGAFGSVSEPGAKEEPAGTEAEAALPPKAEGGRPATASRAAPSVDSPKKGGPPKASAPGLPTDHAVPAATTPRDGHKAALHSTASEERRDEGAIARKPQDVDVTSRQLQWLQRGENLRGLISALHSEGRGLSGSDGPALEIPSWLCWLAVLLGDPGGPRISFDVEPFIPHFVSLGTLPTRQQRYFAAWLSVGLVGPQVERGGQCARQLRPDLLESGWWEESDLSLFCRDQLIKPSMRGRTVYLVSRDSADGIKARLQREIDAAEGIVSMSNNYINTFVKRYWSRLVARGGPVRQLLEDAKRGSPPIRLESAEGLAAAVEGWQEIKSSYRSNILSRLSKFIGHLQLAASANAELRTRDSDKSGAADPDLARKAVDCSHAYLAHLRREGCPSVAGFVTVVGRLEALLLGQASTL